jgi:hypothetical protein
VHRKATISSNHHSVITTDGFRPIIAVREFGAIGSFIGAGDRQANRL